MAFEGLSEKLQNAFRNLRGKGKLSEADVKEALKEVKVALLEADVNFKVVKNFVKTVEEKCVGEEVLNGLNPSQTVIKVVNDELTSLMGSETTEVAFRPGKEITVIMMVGLQGAGKTTASAKMAGQFIKKGKKSPLVACDIYRPAAIEQLKVNGSKVGVDVFEMGTDVKPPVIAENALEKAKKENYNVVILDTAGRLQIDEVLMNELKEIKEKVGVFQTILVVDAMTGQNAVNVAKTFDEEIGIDGVILSKLDGDTRGGAALSIKAVTGKPILYVGMGEKLTDLEQFYPDRMASRILGMGDVLSLIEKAQANVTTTEEESRGMMNRMQKGKFDFNDYLESMKQMKNMGGIASILSMLPGMGVNAADLEGAIDEKKLRQTEAIILSMTPEERSNPKLMNPRRKFRIAKGAGLDIAEVNRFIKQFEQSQKMMKQMGGMGKRGRGMFPGMGGMGGFGGRKGFPFK
ncbi:MAG: signal recognition particle protein [Lachnospiraceae bacterium]|nr:signal recognition particle protein [Lachnospiraceae bacterium]